MQKGMMKTPLQKDIYPLCLCRLLQAGAMKVAKGKKTKKTITINKNLINCCLCSNASYERTWFYGVRVYGSIKIKPVWLPWGNVFMSKPYETLKNWTHWGVMGVINPRHSAGDYQNESISLHSYNACRTVYFHRCHAALIGESNWVEFDSTSVTFSR